MKLTNAFVLVIVMVFIWSCNNDDDGGDDTSVNLQSLSETAIEDEIKIQAFLNSHFYELADGQIVIDTIAGENSDKSPMSEDIESFTVSISPSDIGLVEDDDSAVSHTMYYLVLQEGDINSDFATVADSTYLNYEGSTLDRVVFDAAIGSPVWFDLLGNPLFGSPGVVTGFREGLTKFRQGGAVVENGDGTFEIENPSGGFIIMPSGLGYFSSATPGESYAPLVFKVNVIRTTNADHDSDGIKSILEDLNGNEDFFDDDTDVDAIPNYVDSDDDGDGISTRDEITDDNGNIIIPYPDTDGDGTPDYLDSDN